MECMRPGATASTINVTESASELRRCITRIRERSRGIIESIIESGMAHGLLLQDNHYSKYQHNEKRFLSVSNFGAPPCLVRAPSNSCVASHPPSASAVKFLRRLGPP